MSLFNDRMAMELLILIASSMAMIGLAIFAIDLGRGVLSGKPRRRLRILYLLIAVCNMLLIGSLAAAEFFGALQSTGRWFPLFVICTAVVTVLTAQPLLRSTEPVTK